MSIKIHSKENFDKMRKAGNLAACVLDYITPYVREGVTTNKLDELCNNYILSHNAKSACIGYGTPPYPKHTCISVNEVVCHGIPSERTLKNGDIVNIDVTVIVDGWYGDTSRMFCVGNVDEKAQHLIETTYQAMMLGINEVKPNSTLGDIGYAIQRYAESHGYSVVRDYCGHGIGQVFHDEPSVLHYGKKNTGLKLREGMIFTVEPMINIGGYETVLNNFDQWTVTTVDGSLSAQFEHTIGVTKSGYEIFTLSPKKMYRPPYEETHDKSKL